MMFIGWEFCLAVLQRMGLEPRTLRARRTRLRGGDQMRGPHQPEEEENC